MSIIELEQEIKPLTRLEKLQLIADITRMLQEEEDVEMKQFFKPGEIIDYHGPVIETKAAQQLQEYMDKGLI